MFEAIRADSGGIFVVSWRIFERFQAIFIDFQEFLMDFEVY